MKHLRLALGCAALTLAAATAFGFANAPPPPLDNPQRHVIFDGSGFIYLGPDDELLMESDWLQYSGRIRQFCDFPELPDRHGFIGIDNRQGATPISGWIKLHLDNWDRPNAEKLIWEQVEYLALDVDWELTDHLTLAPDGYSVESATATLQELGDNLFRLEISSRIVGNPPWEEFLWNITVQPYGYFLIDNWEFATICTPEPSSALTLLYWAGALGITLFRQRRR